MCRNLFAEYIYIDICVWGCARVRWGWVTPFRPAPVFFLRYMHEYMAKQFGINTCTVAHKRYVREPVGGWGMICPGWRDVVLFIFSDARAHLVLMCVCVCMWVARNINVYFSIYPTRNRHTHTTLSYVYSPKNQTHGCHANRACNNFRSQISYAYKSCSPIAVSTTI